MRRLIRGVTGLGGVGPLVMAAATAGYAFLVLVLLTRGVDRAGTSSDLLVLSVDTSRLTQTSAERVGPAKADFLARLGAARFIVAADAGTALESPDLPPFDAGRLKAAVGRLLAATLAVGQAQSGSGDAAAGQLFYSRVRPAVSELDLSLDRMQRDLAGDADRDRLVGLAFGALAGAAVVATATFTHRRLRRLTREASDRARFEAVVSGSADGILLSDAAGLVQYASPAASATLGITRDRWSGGRLRDHVIGTDVAFLDSLAARALDEPGAAHGGRVVALHSEGHRLYLDVLVHRLAADVVSNPDYALVWTLRDVTGAQVMEQRLRQLAFFDPLTGLPNRLLLGDRVEQALAARAAGGGGLVVAVVDLDRFREVLDALGNAVGDQIIVETSRRLRAGAPAGQTLARIGPDTFVAVLEGPDTTAAAVAAARTLADAVAAPMAFDGLEHRVTCSVGVAVADGKAVAEGKADAESLLRRAHTALHTVKVRGGGTVALFEESMLARATERIELGSGLARARRRGELELVYQPVVDLASGYVGGVEALLRWRHSRLGLLLPESFVGLAEEIGFIGDIGGWALDEACRQAVQWSDRLGSRAPTSVAVNLSALQLCSADLVGEVAAALSRWGLDPGTLVLEITESALVEDLPAARARLGELKQLGVRLAIDDFGVGYSSLSYLRHFPVDVLKVDRSFLATPDQTVLKGICSIGASLGLRTVGEGVETPEQARLMLEAGCQAAQGFLFAAPGPAPEIEPLLGVVLDVVPERTINLDTAVPDPARPKQDPRST